MVSFGEKAKIKKAGNLNYGRSYVITTVPDRGAAWLKLFKENKPKTIKDRILNVSIGSNANAMRLTTLAYLCRVL